MKQENLKTIQEAVYAAVPSLKELSFGCRGTYDNKEVILLRYGMDFQNVDGPDVYVWQKGDGGRYMTSDNQYVEIIGHPIYLQHVLAAMQGLASDDENRHWVVNRWGEFLRELPKGKGAPFSEVAKAQWNLHETLSNQSEETLQFLADLLITKEK